MIKILESYSPMKLATDIIAKGSCPYCKDDVNFFVSYHDEIAFHSCCGGEVAVMVTKAIAAEEKLGGCCKWVIIKDVFDSSSPGFCANHKYIGASHIMDEPPIVKAAHIAISTGKSVKYMESEEGWGAKAYQEEWGTVGYLDSVDMHPTILSFGPKWMDPLDLEEVKSLVYGQWQGQWQEGPSNENPAATINWGDVSLVGDSTELSDAANTLPGIHMLVAPPCDCYDRDSDGKYIYKNSIRSVIMHLNDNHKWTRERIADWLDEIDDPYGDGPDLAFEVPEGE